LSNFHTVKFSVEGPEEVKEQVRNQNSLIPVCFLGEEEELAGKNLLLFMKRNEYQMY
jgi:hypothetical protein